MIFFFNLKKKNLFSLLLYMIEIVNIRRKWNTNGLTNLPLIYLVLTQIYLNLNSCATDVTC